MKRIIINLDSHPADARLKVHIDNGRQWVSVNGVVVIDGPAGEDWIVQNRDGVVFGSIAHRRVDTSTPEYPSGSDE